MRLQPQSGGGDELFNQAMTTFHCCGGEMAEAPLNGWLDAGVTWSLAADGNCAAMHDDGPVLVAARDGYTHTHPPFLATRAMCPAPPPSLPPPKKNNNTRAHAPVLATARGDQQAVDGRAVLV